MSGTSTKPAALSYDPLLSLFLFQIPCVHFVTIYHREPSSSLKGTLNVNSGRSTCGRKRSIIIIIKCVLHVIRTHRVYSKLDRFSRYRDNQRISTSRVRILGVISREKYYPFSHDSSYGNNKVCLQLPSPSACKEQRAKIEFCSPSSSLQ